MEGSCIQTVPGRGYRFVLPVRRNEELREVRAQPAVTETPRFAEVSGDHAVAVSALPMPATQRRRRVLSITALAGVCLAIAALLLVARSHNFWLTSPSDRPRLSLVVLPFENLSGDPKDDYLADGITDDLSHISGAFVIARESAYTYKGKPKDVRKIGEELGVRCVLEGSVRRLGASLRVNVQLVSGETGAHLWSDRFDEQGARNSASTWSSASLWLGRDEDAIRFLERSISINPDFYGHQWTYRFLCPKGAPCRGQACTRRSGPAVSL